MLPESQKRLSGSFFLIMRGDINQAAPAPENKNHFNKKSLRQIFESGSEIRYQTAKDIENRVEQTLSSMPSPPSLKIRIKKFDSYYRKYIHLVKSGADPQITDLIGIRVVCPFIEELETVETLLKEHFDVIEAERKGHYTFKEFGYESIHLLIKIPADIAQTRGPTDCNVFEIQIRTILQDAWAEVEHELVYKAEFNPFGISMKRKLAAVNASLSLADIIFQEIRSYQKQLSGQLEKRRETFYQKIEEYNDAFLSSQDITVQKANNANEPIPLHDALSSVDDLLLSALYAHNKNQFEDAIAMYSKILELKPENRICSLIYKHRGMANFAQSKYDDAVKDFTSAFDLDAKSYKTVYYRGVVLSVQKQYAEAVDDFTLSLEINPYQSFCLFRRGQAYYHLGDYPQALADCEAALEMDSDNEAMQKFRLLIQNKLKM